MTSETIVDISLKDHLYNLRKECLELEGKLRDAKKFITTETVDGDKAEMLGQITLAFRHLEDARMRIGKTVQYHDGGKSVYEK